MNYIKIGNRKIKLIVTEESTVIDEKNRRVIHKIAWLIKMDKLFEHILYCLTGDWFNITGVTKGVAVCNPEDEFDPELGKKLARAIAESNAYRNASRRLRKKLVYFSAVFDQYVSQVVDFKIKADDVIVHNREYQDNLVK